MNAPSAATLDARIARFPARGVATSAGTVGVREAGSAGNGLPAQVPTVLLHGIGSGSGSWLGVLERIAGGERFLAWDAPGYGITTPLTQSTPAASDYAAVLAHLVDALGLQRFHLVGHSLGCLMAGAYAAAHPEHLASLSLLSPAGGYGDATPALRNEKRDARLKMLNELGPTGMAEKRSAQLLSPDASAEALELVRWNTLALNPPGYAQATHMLAGGTLSRDLGRYTGPVLVACGSADTVTPEPGCRKIAASCMHADYRSLPGLGHACYVESPDAVLALLRGFWKDQA